MFNLFDCIKIYSCEASLLLSQLILESHLWFIELYSLCCEVKTSSVNFLHSMSRNLLQSSCFFKVQKKHYQYLQLIIECLCHAELYVNLKKYEFFKTEMKYLDFLVNEKNLHMNSFCIKTVSKWCSHLFRIYCNIQVFIKFCNFYQYFIYNFINIVWLLHLLFCDMKKDRKSDLIADE